MMHFVAVRLLEVPWLNYLITDSQGNELKKKKT